MGKSCWSCPPIPHKYVLHVKHALQGHPEAPPLWEQHINMIIHDVGFTPINHEPCLYHAIYHGHRVLFLHQVDDFAIEAHDPTIPSQLIKLIDSKMSISVKHLGLILRFNGIDILQTQTLH